MQEATEQIKRRTGITSIEVNNFKSFKHLKVSLANFSLLIGANASGKSNFFEIFKFLSDTSKYGLSNAISLQGGVEYFLNANAGKDRNFSVKVSAEYGEKTGYMVAKQSNDYYLLIDTRKIEYELHLKFDQGDNYTITKEKLILDCDFLKTSTKSRRRKGASIFEKPPVVATSKIFASRSADSIRTTSRNLPKEITLSSLFPKYISRTPKKTLLEPPVSYYLDWASLLQDLAIYDFDPKLPKKAVSFSGKTQLDTDGSNLTIVLKSLMESEAQMSKFKNLISDLLPWVDDISVESVAHKSLLFNLKEKYAKDLNIPASLVSEGTINVLAIVYALYFERAPIIFIEEPEKNIHPLLIGKIANMFDDASTKKQIIVTTHNPELIKYTKPENILLISRGDDGYSKIRKPSKEKEIVAFLAENMSMDELFRMDLFGR